MTILTAAQSAIARLVGRRPAAVVSSLEEIDVEITALAYEAATDIAKAQDWQALTEYAELMPDGVATSLPLPADFDRMTQDGALIDPATWFWGYQHIVDQSEWLRYTARGYNLTPGAWTLRGGRLHFSPAPEAGNTVQFPYISRNIFVGQNGTPKPLIDRDDDSFRLDERLLSLALIWRWKQMKQMDYQEDFRNYEIALSQEMARDGGPRVQRDNGRSRFPGAVTAWPWALGPGA